jgi:cytochrome c-type protein NapC
VAERFFQAVKAFVRKRARLIALLCVPLLIGIGLSAGYATAVQVTSTQNFCAHGCHEMERSVAREYAASKHARNASGAVTTCAQCHNPQGNWLRTLGSEIGASSRLWGHVVGREYLPGRFEARRPALAEKVLQGFKASNARECKACHLYDAMLLGEQSQTARRDHAASAKTDANCLDCHQGVAHQRMDQPAGYDLP